MININQNQGYWNLPKHWSLFTMYVNYGSSIIMSKVRQKISVIKTNTCDDIKTIVYLSF